MRTTLSALVLLLISALAAAAPQATIMVRPDSEAVGGSVVLGDISTVQCADKALAQRLTSIEVCSSPLPGKTRRLTKEQILVALRRAGIGDGTVELLCPAEVTVMRKSSVISGQALFEAAKQFVVAGNSLPGTVAVEPVRPQAGQAAPAGKVELRVRPGAREARKGQNSFPVEVIVDGQVYRMINVSVLVKVLAPVLVSTQAIPRLAEISDANVVLQERDITTLPGDILLEKPAVGWTASVPICEGAVIRRSWVAAPLAVKSGDAVLVVVDSGAVRVIEKGTAVQDGRPGDRIKVRLLGDIREVRGTIAEPGIVKIFIGRRN